MLRTNLPSIGFDLTGSDRDSDFVLASLLPVLDSFKDSACFTLFGEERNGRLIGDRPFVSLTIADEIISMEEDPIKAWKTKKRSAVRLGMEALKEKKINAFLTMGHTGALLTAAAMQIPKLPSITRPALAALIPAKNKKTTAVLDVGANTQYKSSHLVQFAAMGLIYQTARGIVHPTVGLLNIGTEANKGTPELQAAYKTLSHLSRNYKYPFFSGNVEARDAFDGTVDVLITDGFTGNIFLKTSEGIARFLSEETTERLPKRHLDYGEYPGALLCGIDGIVVKCHGTAKEQAFRHSLVSVLQLIQENFIEEMKSNLRGFF